MDKHYKTGDKIDIQISFVEGLAAGEYLAASIIGKFKEEAIMLKEGAGITNTDQLRKVYLIELLPARTVKMRPGKYEVELKVYNTNHTFQNISLNKAEFTLGDSELGKEDVL